MGITELFPDEVIVKESGFQLDDPCFYKAFTGCRRGVVDNACEEDEPAEATPPAR